jgi:hypothetical protein
VKFLVDMPLPPALARWLAAQGDDAVHADAVGFGRSTDREILNRARQEAQTRGDRRSQLSKVAGFLPERKDQA